MDQAVAALREHVVDDVHVMNNFCDLCDNLTARIRSRFVRMAAYSAKYEKYMKEKAKSRSTEKTSPASKVQATVPLASVSPSVSTEQWASGSQGYMPNTSMLTSNNADNNILYSISRDTYDPETNNMSIVPPPTFQYNAAGSDTSSYDYSIPFDNAYQSDWLALPLDPLVNDQFGANITQTTYGPDVNGLDLLDVLLPHGG